MYSPRRLQHYTIDHGRLIGDQPVQPYLLDCISKLVEIHGLLDVAVCAQAITIHEIPLFFRGSHDDHGDSLGPRIAVDLPEDFDSIHRGQANARALEIFGAVKALEDAEQLIGILHAEADAIVANENGRIPVFFHLADFDDGAETGTGEFKRVSHQILKNLLDQDRVAFNKRKVRDNPFHLPAFTLRL